MKKGLTELVFIVDRSGSMSGLEKDTIGGFNSMLREQQAQPGQALVTTILFDDIVSLLHDRLDIQSVAPLSDQDYTVGGCTALLDAVGMAMHRIRKNQERDREEDRPEKTLFVIITDGMENSSRHYTYEMIRQRVERQKKLGWEFLFFGANMDAIAQASDIGIDADMAQNYVPSARGTSAAWSSMSAASSAVRAGRRPVFGGPGKTQGSGSGETDATGLTGSADTVDSQDIEEAMLSVKGKLSALVGSFHEFYDVVNELRESADANGGKVPDVNEILRSVLEDREEEEKE